MISILNKLIRLTEDITLNLFENKRWQVTSIDATYHRISKELGEKKPHNNRGKSWKGSEKKEKLS